MDEGRAQQDSIEKLVGLRDALQKGEYFGSATDMGLMAESLRENLADAEASRTWWRQNPVPVLCDDHTLQSLASQVKAGAP